jgi:hypothetical protein
LLVLFQYLFLQNYCFSISTRWLVSRSKLLIGIFLKLFMSFRCCHFFKRRCIVIYALVFGALAWISAQFVSLPLKQFEYLDTVFESQ